jgi:hypothetical protein
MFLRVKMKTDLINRHVHVIISIGRKIIDFCKIHLILKKQKCRIEIQIWLE